jgi:hypothetical protein
MSDNTCGHCARLRKNDGYCRAKGIYVNALSTEPCFVSPDGEELPPIQAKRSREKKICKECGKLLPLSDFPLHPKSRDGHDGLCKDCKSKKARAVQERLAEQRGYRKAEKSVPDPDVPEGMKRCKRCSKILPVSAFGKHPTTYDRLHPICTECRREDGRKAQERRAEREGRIIGQPRNLTDAQMVEKLRSHGWTVTCTRTKEEAL